jgi:hypothetical protein
VIVIDRVLCHNKQNHLTEEPMNEQSNLSMSPEPAAGIAGWFSIWMDAVTKPKEETYAALAASSGGKLSVAFLWVFLGSLATSFLATLVQGPMMRQMLRQFQQLGMDVPDIPIRTGRTFLSAICGAPVAAVIIVVFFALSVGIIQWVAKMFGGKGTFEQLAYAFAAISFPINVVRALLTLLSAIPFVGLCFSVVSIVVALYGIVLSVMAVKGVNQFGWGEALGSFFLPVILFFCLCLCVVFGFSAALGALLRQSFGP